MMDPRQEQEEEQEKDTIIDSGKQRRWWRRRRRPQCAACNAMEPEEQDADSGVNGDEAECRDCCLKCTSLWLIIVEMFVRLLTILKS